MGRIVGLVLLGSGLLWTPGCRSAQGEPRSNGGQSPKVRQVTVLAAASLAGAFQEIKPLFEAKHTGHKLVFSFAGSNECATQIEHGARADVFASADQKHMDQLEQKGLVGTRRNFVSNVLCVAVRQGIAPPLARFEDLSRPGLRLVMGDDNVPVGRYTNEALRHIEDRKLCGEGCVEKIRRNIVSKEANVKLVVAKVSLGEADAAFCYRSDITPDLRSKLEMMSLPREVEVLADYPVATLKEARDPEGAKAFVDFLLTAEAQTVFERQGFIPVRRAGGGREPEGSK